MREYVWYVKQKGETVAKGFCPNLEWASAEAHNYASQYAAEGETEVIVRKCPRKRKAK